MSKILVISLEVFFPRECSIFCRPITLLIILDSLSLIIDSSVKYGLCDIGNFGEQLAQYFLLRAAFFCIDSSLKKVRKLVFQPVTLRNLLSRLAGEYGVVVDEFFTELHSSLGDSLVSFGYFEYFSGRPISRPFDLMARCLFRGSAVALNSLFPGIDLMIPLVLKDGRISFLGIQVKFVKEDNVKRTVKDALKK